MGILNNNVPTIIYSMNKSTVPINILHNRGIIVILKTPRIDNREHTAIYIGGDIKYLFELLKAVKIWMAVSIHEHSHSSIDGVVCSVERVNESDVNVKENCRVDYLFKKFNGVIKIRSNSKTWVVRIGEPSCLSK